MKCSYSRDSKNNTRELVRMANCVQGSLQKCLSGYVDE